MTATALSPCPFCASPARVEALVPGFHHYGSCTVCTAIGPARDTEQAAALAWNQRSAQPGALFDRGAQYSIEPAPIGPRRAAVRAWTVTGGQEPYRVEVDGHGEWSCTCPAFKFQVGRRVGCKHTALTKDAFLKEPAGATP